MTRWLAWYVTDLFPHYFPSISLFHLHMPVSEYPRLTTQGAPLLVHHSACTYQFTWPTAAACPFRSDSGAACSVADDLGLASTLAYCV